MTNYTVFSRFSIPYGDTEETKKQAIATADAIEKMLKEHVTKRVDYKHKTVIKVFEKKQS